jgi:hypothetical protein
LSILNPYYYYTYYYITRYGQIKYIFYGNARGVKRTLMYTNSIRY